jgi:glycosyltransferase involved in cell wall biosynthesis
MRIGIDATALPPQPVGAGNYIIHLIRALAAMDSEDEFVIFSGQRGPSLINLPEKPTLKWILLPDRNPGVRLIWEQTYFSRLIRDSGVDLLHSLHYTRPLRLSCASVVTFHDMTFFLYPELHTRTKRFYFPLAIRSSAKRANFLIAISESTRQDTIRLLNLSPDRVITIQHGVDPSFRPLSDIDLKKRITKKYRLPDKIILYVGLIEPRKNLPLLIKAYKKLVDDGTEHYLVLAGRYGWMFDEVLQQIEKLSLTDKVILTGYVDQIDLPMVYNLSDLFVYPTLYEGFGLPALEAMACGIPVITTKVSSLPEIVGEAGILVPPNDAEELFRGMKTVLQDEELRLNLARQGTEQAAKFTWERTARSTLEVYQRAIKTSRT